MLKKWCLLANCFDKTLIRNMNAFEFAKANGKTNVAIVTKANIMKKTDGKVSQIAHEIAKEYPEITAEEWYIDIMTANLVNENIRSNFQVFVMPNLYGDIITDEAAQIQGGVGTAGSANIGDKYAMFEPIHGTAPRLIEAGRGDYANPTSMFKATEMMLRHIGFIEKANKLNKALNSLLPDDIFVRRVEEVSDNFKMEDAQSRIQSSIY